MASVVFPSSAEVAGEDADGLLTVGDGEHGGERPVGHARRTQLLPNDVADWYAIFTHRYARLAVAHGALDGEVAAADF